MMKKDIRNDILIAFIALGILSIIGITITIASLVAQEFGIGYGVIALIVLVLMGAAFFLVSMN